MRHAIWLLLLAFVALAVTYSVVTPIFEASDELWHYPVVQYIAAGHGLPVQTPPDRPGLWKQQASQAPLYYALAAWVTSWIDTSDLNVALRPNPHAAIGVVTPDGNINMAAHDPAREGWPWRGTVLAVHLARLLSAAMGAATVYLTYRLGREAFPDRQDIALAAAAFTAFTPMFLFISGSVNNDNLVILLCALALWLMIWLGKGAGIQEWRALRFWLALCIALGAIMLTQARLFEAGLLGFLPLAALTSALIDRSNSDALHWTRGWLGLGVVIGLATLSKVSGLALLPLAALTGVWVAWRRGPIQAAQPATEPQSWMRGLVSKVSQITVGDSQLSGQRDPAFRQASGISRVWRDLFAIGTVIGFCVLLLAGWWFWRNLRLYGDLTGMRMFTPYFTRPVPADLAQIWRERISFLYGYWGNFGGLNLPIPAWAFATLNVLLVLAAARWLISLALSRWVQRAMRRARQSLVLRSSPFALYPSSFDIRRSTFDIRHSSFVIFLWGAIVFVAWLAWTRTTWSSQGRLVFYALPSYSILIVAGLSAWLPRRVAPYALGALCGGMALFSAAMPFAVIAPAYARPPKLTPAQLASIPQRADVTFGDSLVLLGYDPGTAREPKAPCPQGAVPGQGVCAPTDSARPGDSIPITLYWQALKPLDRDYSVFVHLLDENDIEAQAQDRAQAYPGRGNLPTTTLTPGQTWAETWIMPIQSTAYAPARLTWEVGLFDMASALKTRLTAVDKNGHALGDNIRLGKVALTRPPGSEYNPVSRNFGDQIELIGFDLDRRQAAPGETIKLTLYWRALRALRADRNLTVFAHVLEKPQTLWAQGDQAPTPPTAQWRLGQTISDTYSLKLKPDTPTGVYEIEIGVYFFTPSGSIERLKIITSGGQLQEDYVLLSRVRVTR